jgi:hypothetical protein
VAYGARIEDETAFLDRTGPDVGITLKIVTGWIHASSVQGFMRAFRALLLGESKSSHTLQVRVRFDYEETWNETHTITSANATDNGSAYQFEVRFARQKCQAIQLEITDLTPTAEAFTLAGLALEIGVLPGARRLPAVKSV